MSRFHPTSVAITKILAAVLSAATTAGAQEAPTIELLGERFQPTRGGMQGSLGVGFDPVNREVLSVQLTDLCGASVDPGIFADAGCSWDPITQELWMITPTRVVFRWLAGGQRDTLFVIPETFNVPGVGADTLESAQGLALDSTHVYVVDVGPDIGELDSNAWFKFTRDGTPVSSSKATDFVANLDAAPDAIVDGICWIPPGSPFGEGLFLIPLEHSGIMVVDENGFFVDELLWQDAGLDYGSDVPFAFAGLTIDPLTGDLYVVENAGQIMHVWLRVKEQTPPRSRYFGHGGDIDALYPDVDCVRPLPQSFPGLQSRFALAYRDVDGLFWTIDYDTGEVLTADPKEGFWNSRGSVSVVNVWGMAWDDQLDRFYIATNSTGVVYLMDPVTLATTALPQSGGQAIRDLTFDRVERVLYGADFDRLYAIDPVSGSTLDLGPVKTQGSIAWDSLTGTLVGSYLNGELWEITSLFPTTQVQIATLPTGSSWEALEAIPGGGSGTAAPISPAPAAPALRVFPNPTRGGTRVAFAAARPGPVQLDVVDVTGRLVRRLTREAAAGGNATMEWNGRDAAGRPASAGVYFVRLTTGEGTSAAKVSVIR
jgi:hypothetical protein